MAIRAATDPTTLLAAAVAGVEQARNNFLGYGRELGGYAKRYGSAYGDRLVGAMMVMPFFRRFYTRILGTSTEDQAALALAYFMRFRPQSSAGETTGN